MDIPSTEAVAREHIAQVRRSKGLDGPESNTADLEAALIILSEQLYQKSTHFLLELIQNADDNTYEDGEPTLKISCRRQTLRLDCNELGFGKKNVEAICKIGRSTKAGLSTTTRYTGEKGIGFKSVFKVADVVWIKSGHYSFKFDKKTPLGMIAPIWEKFPEPALEGHTSIILQLSPDYDPGELVAEIQTLDPRLLVFLRKLKKVNLMTSHMEGAIWSSHLYLQDKTFGEGERDNIVTLWYNSEMSSLKVTKFTVLEIPPSSKRPGIKQSDILFAFPISDKREPSIQTQKVYAFLPIRDYGFKFLIQADFLLIASREDIDCSSAWNRKLLEAVPYAFLEAVHDFNKANSKSRYTWMRFLPNRPQLSDFFTTLQDTIDALLSKSNIIENFNGEFVAPSKLKLLPADFRDLDGLPLISLTRSTPFYISPNYSDEDAPALERIGVKSLSADDFVAELRTFVSESSTCSEFWKKDHFWHSRVSRALIRILNGRKNILPALAELPIVPLADGRWVSPSQGNICFSSPSESLTIPNGIEVHPIHPVAASDSSRRTLFIILGAKTFSKDLVCDAIVKMHVSPDFKPEHRSLPDLMGDIIFLFQASWKNTEKHNLWLVTESGTILRGSDLYMDSKEPNTATTLFTKDRKRFQFIHRDYFGGKCSADQTWLVENLYVQQYPRLVGYFFRSESTISDDFRYLIENCSSQQILLLLRDNWRLYSEWIIPDDSSKEKLVSDVTRILSSMQVSCRGGKVTPLNQTILPLSSMIGGQMTTVSFLDVPEPDDPSWKNLRHLGVVVEAGASPFIQCLRNLKASGATLAQISELYQQIQCYSEADGEIIRNSFRTDQLIYIPIKNPGDPGNWIDLDICVWDGPKFLRKTPCLKDIYPEHRSFFYETLGTVNATLDTIIDEAQQLDHYDSVSYIAKVFIYLAEFCRKGIDNPGSAPMDKSNVLELNTHRIFPVTRNTSYPNFAPLLSAEDHDMWFIADRQHLRHSFQELVPLLAFNVETIEKIKPLIHILKLEHRLLSNIAYGIPRVEGAGRPCMGYTSILRAKSRAIARLIPPTFSNRKSVIVQLRNIEVYSVVKVTIEWTVLKLGQRYIGRTESGRVKLTQVSNILKVILREHDLDPSRPPLELSEELTEFCGIKNPSHMAIVHWILMQKDLKEIDDVLQRRGIADDIPEFRMPVAGEDIVFSGLDETDDSDIKSRSYVGRKEKLKPSGGEESVDAVQSFIDRFNLATTFKNKINQAWKDGESTNMLSHICRLENMDPFLLLPQKNDHWVERVQKAGGHPDDYIGLAFDEETSSFKKEHLLRSTQVFPATVKVTGQGHIRVAVSAAANHMPDLEIMFAGELYVSRMLGKYMDSSYASEIHWTSHLRSRAGLMPFENSDITQSTFTIPDSSGTFTRLLAQQGYKQASSWKKYPTYHIEVVTSASGLLSRFCLGPDQVQKARSCNMGMKITSSPMDVFVLIRIYNVHTAPELALIVDPWQMHIDGILSLTTEAHYEAHFTKNPHAIRLSEPTKLPISTRPLKAGIERGFGSVLRRSNRSSQPPFEAKQIETIYSYRTLGFGQIRLLELIPGDDTAPITGFIRHVPLEDAGRYSALSYVWGPALKPFELQTREGSIQLTAPLYSALRRLRQRSLPTILWVDAVCINQEEDHEKTIQIRMLRSIFQNADKVFAWIGDERDQSNRAIETLLQIRTQALKPDQWPKYLPAIPSTWKNHTPAPDDLVWSNIGRFFQREWFQRAWVVQELVLARHVRIVCGTWDVNWDDIFGALELSLSSISSVQFPNARIRQISTHSKPAYALGLTRRMFNDPRLSRRFTLLSLLDMFAHTDATKVRDKLFALLGLASDAASEVFDPNYSASLEVVIRKYAKEFVVRGNAIDLLYRAGISNSFDFCSWIPNWTGRDPSRTISTWRGAKGNFSAGGNRETQVELIGPNREKLKVLGAGIDNITDLSPSTTKEHDIISIVNMIHSSIDNLNSYPTGESIQDLKLKLPIGDAMAPCSDDVGTLDLDVAEIKKEDQHFNWTEQFSGIKSVQQMVDFLKQPRDARERSWKYWTTAAAFAKRLSNARFCMSGSYVGFVPHDAQIGDLICLFYGGAVPFVVREVPLTDSEYELIGECYIHGIMYGEALKFEGILDETFTLV